MFKSFFLFLSLVFLLTYGCNESSNEIQTPNESTTVNDGSFDTLDLTVDQVQVGGMSELDVNYYLSIGYVADTLENAQLFNVQFLGDDGYYNQVGYIRAGEIIFYYPFSEPMTGYAKTCTNQLELFD